MSAVSEGISDNFSFYLLAIANGCSAVGRVVGGYFADRTGPLNIMTPATVIAGVMTYVWPFATGIGGNIGVAIVYGYVPLSHETEALTLTPFAFCFWSRSASSGVYVSLLAAPVVRMGKTHDVGVRVGMSMTLVALGAVAGPPISGAINDATGGFKFVGIYAGTQGCFAFPALACLILSIFSGSAVMLACAFMIATRISILGGLWGKV